jgi:hypothetical protein
MLAHVAGAITCGWLMVAPPQGLPADLRTGVVMIVALLFLIDALDAWPWTNSGAL